MEKAGQKNLFLLFINYMMQKQWSKSLLPHVIAILIFLLVAVIYCRPAYQNKVLVQEDVSQWKAMAQNSFQYKDEHGHFPLWSEGMFSGMPAYQIAMDAPVISLPYYLYDVFTLWLKKPASFFFLACICFYFLTQVLRVSPFVGMATALTYAYATYNAVIVAVGHDTKMQAIALLPAFIGSLILIYEKRYWWGAALTGLSTALFVAAQHPQIVYYGLIIAVFMTAGYAIRWIRQKDFRHLVIAAVLAVTCGAVGVLCNAVLSFTTYDYAKATIRGGSELAVSGGRETRTGLSQDYAFSYSMYKSEPFTLLVPKMFGGSGGPTELSEDKSRTVAALQGMPPQLGQYLQQYIAYYWGGISDSTGGPAYAGAIVVFLALAGFFLLDNKHKWWILGACVLSIVMSWGGYFAGFNGFLLKVLPGYNKFRAPSMIMVIPNFLLCMLAAMSLQKIVAVTAADRAAVWEKYRKGLFLTGAVFAILLVLYVSLDYSADMDRQPLQRLSAGSSQVLENVHRFIAALHQDRQSLFFGSMVRSFLFIAAAAVVAGPGIKGRLRPLLVTVIIGALAFIDLMGIDLQYLSAGNYQEAEAVRVPFKPTQADQQILQDKGYYRVFDLREGLQTLTYGAPTAYFHRSIGGYHPAKLSIYEDLIEHQLYKFPDCQPVIDMLNTRYLIEPAGQGGDSVVVNPGAPGAAWFVRAVQFRQRPQAVMEGLTGLDVKDTAIVFEGDRGRVGIGGANGQGAVMAVDPVRGDSAAGMPGGPAAANGQDTDSITLLKNDNDDMEYRSVSGGRRFAIFSEVYYDRGWRAYIDGQETPIIRTNYVLRGLTIPAGKHAIRMVFHPDSYYTGQKVQWAASVILALLLAGAVVVEGRKGVIF